MLATLRSTHIRSQHQHIVDEGEREKKKRDTLGSADGATPGTILDGEKAACSISVK